MRSLKIAVVVLCLVVPMVAGSPHTNSFTFSTISLPIYPHGINPTRGIVGDFCCVTDSFGDTNDFIGFIQGQGPFNFLLLQPSGAATSYATGINASGDVVGGFCTASDPCAELVGEHGYEFEGVEFGGPIFNQIDYPGASSTTANGINNAGVIVGTYCLSEAACPWDGGDHGFMDSGGTFTAINYPGATTTSALAINTFGVVVGAYNSGSQLHAYILSAGVYTTIDPPGAVSAEAEGINSSGEVVGTYLDGSNKTHGFTYVSGVFTNVDVPGALITTTTGIDDQGEIVGSYQVASGAYIGYGGKSQ